MVQPSSRERLGRELRLLRVRAALSGQELAERLGVHQSKISRTETARFRASLEVVRRWLDVTGAGERHSAELLALADDALVEALPYHRIWRGSLATGQRSLIRDDAAAARIRHFQPSTIPGPLHTAIYARAALLSAWQAPGDDIDTAVAERLKRGDLLRSPDTARYEVILTEAALRWRPVGATHDDQAQAWRKILHAMALATVSIQVIPQGTPMRQAPMCGFIIYEFPPGTGDENVVKVELPSVQMTFSRTDDLAAFDRTWQAMQDAALNAEASASFVEDLLR